MKRASLITLIAMLALTLTAIGAFAQQARTGTKSQRGENKDKGFVLEAAQGGMMEVALGNLAQQKGQNQQVKDFGQRMVTDHTKANDQLKAIAQQKGIKIPERMGARHRLTETRLKRHTGAAFDKAYIQTMVSDHKKDVAAFEREAQQGADPDVKQFAATTLPILREHLQMAQSIQASLAGQPANGDHGTTGTAHTTRAGAAKAK